MRRPSAAALTALAAPLLLATGPAAPPPIVSLIDAIEQAMPLTPDKVARLLPPPARCDAQCRAGYATRVGALPVGDVDARIHPPAFVLVLSRLGGTCVPVAALARRYGATRVVNSCTDGGVCMVAYAQRRWGTLAFSLPPDGDGHACAREVIVNSDHTR